MQTVSSDRAPDQLAADRRLSGARRGALPALSRDRARAGRARLPGRTQHLAVRDVPAHHRAVQSFGVRLGRARRGAAQPGAAVDRADVGRARCRRLRAGAAQCQPRGAGRGAVDPQPGASRAGSRVSASTSSRRKTTAPASWRASRCRRCRPPTAASVAAATGLGAGREARSRGHAVMTRIAGRPLR